MNKTKILATISQLRGTLDYLQKLIDAGVDGFRINTAHISLEEAIGLIKNIRKTTDKIPIVIDTKGPEVRTTNCEPIKLKKDETILIRGNAKQNSSKQLLCTNYNGFHKDLNIGAQIIIDDGEVELKVIKKKKDALLCKVIEDGVVKGYKGVNTPGINLKLPSVSKRDKEFIKIAAEFNVEFIAHSFVRNKKDVQALQKEINKYKSKIEIIAKIENQEGVDNIDEILDDAYGIMIARGDLGIEVPAEKIPFIQQKLTRKAIERSRLVITATQMLHSMIENPRPTRAEVTDVASAILEGTDAIMLSGETAMGKYPIKAVETMVKIAKEVESERRGYHNHEVRKVVNKITSYLARSAMAAAHDLPVKAVVIDTYGGRTARYLSSYRGENNIYAFCYQQGVKRELNLHYGVEAFYLEEKADFVEFHKEAFTRLIKMKFLTKEDMVVVVAGSFGKDHGASYVEISTAENMLKH